MAQRKGDYAIPFDDNGNQLHWASTLFQDVEWRENHEFDATLKYETYARGRSAAYFVFRDTTTGTVYTMFLKELDELLKKRTLFDGLVYGRWTFVKRGENYGIKPIALKTS